MSTEWQTDNIENCPICHGIGSIEVKVPGGYRIDPCRCALATSARKGLLDACIPRRYYDWDLRNLQKTFKIKNSEAISAIKKYIDALPNNIKSGQGLWISAPSGLHKNAFACYILKNAIENNFRVYYAKAATLLSKKVESWKEIDSKIFIRHFIDNSDLVAITDIEKTHLTSSPNDFKTLVFYEMLSDLDENRTSLIVSSNIPKSAVLIKMPLFVRQRLRSIREVVLRYANFNEDDF